MKKFIIFLKKRKTLQNYFESLKSLKIWNTLIKFSFGKTLKKNLKSFERKIYKCIPGFKNFFFRSTKFLFRAREQLCCSHDRNMSQMR